MYKAIAAHPTTLEIYGKKLVGEGVVTDGEVEKMKADWRDRLDAELEAAQSYRANKADWLDGRWAGFKAGGDGDDPRRGETGVADRGAQGHRREDHHAAAGLPSPSHDQPLPRQPPQGDRDRRQGIDWATGEALAFARCCSKATACGSPARTASAAPSRSAIPC